jgi:hypothetical protein
MHDYVLREIEIGPRAALCEDMEACGVSELDEMRAPEADPAAPVPYVLTPKGEAVAAYPDTWDRDLWMALDAGEQPDPEAEREARRQGDDMAWGGRGPSASYAEWLAEGQAEAEAGS